MIHFLTSLKTYEYDSVLAKNVCVGLHIESPEGFTGIKAFYKKIFNTFRSIRTKHYEIICSGGQLVKTDKWIKASKVKVGDKLTVNTGKEEVTEVKIFINKDLFYGFRLNSYSENFYANGILTRCE